MKSLNVHERDLINQVARICKLVHVSPATGSTGERCARSFSTARRVKTWLRSRMHRFTHLSVLNTHNTRLDGICLLSVVNAFVSFNDNRKINFGKFTVTDFH